MLEIYSDALLRFFNQLRWHGKSIPCVFSGADRAYSQIRDWLKVDIGSTMGIAIHSIWIPGNYIGVNL